jgi:phosphopantetheinyl transferase (holo-ACP synthase)
VSSFDHLVGIDLVDTSTRSNSSKNVEEYVRMFKQQLTSNELAMILRYPKLKFVFSLFCVLNYLSYASAPTEKDKYDIFYLIWSLKESFIKAIGLGLGYNLLKVRYFISV